MQDSFDTLGQGAFAVIKARLLTWSPPGAGSLGAHLEQDPTPRSLLPGAYAQDTETRKPLGEKCPGVGWLVAVTL